MKVDSRAAGAFFSQLYFIQYNFLNKQLTFTSRQHNTDNWENGIKKVNTLVKQLTQEKEWVIQNRNDKDARGHRKQKNIRKRMDSGVPSSTYQGVPEQRLYWENVLVGFTIFPFSSIRRHYIINLTILLAKWHIPKCRYTNQNTFFLNLRTVY